MNKISISVTDETANADKIIKNAVDVIGKSQDRLEFFRIVYNGKLSIKTQNHIVDNGKFPNPKRVLEIGKSFVIRKIVKQTKDNNKKIAYEKIPIYSHHKSKIILMAQKNINGYFTKEKKDKSKKKYSKKWDVFVSHAYQDKKIATPFVKKLKENNIKVWYDTDILQWGDSLSDSINKGLKSSLFGLVILSKTFFKKKWTKTELKALMSLANSKDNMRILPLFYKITHDEIVKEYPLLSDFYGRSWDDGLDKLTKEIKQLVRKKRK